MKVGLVYFNVSRVTEETSVHFALQAFWYFCSYMSILQDYIYGDIMWLIQWQLCL